MFVGDGCGVLIPFDWYKLTTGVADYKKIIMSFILASLNTVSDFIMQLTGPYCRDVSLVFELY